MLVSMAGQFLSSQMIMEIPFIFFGEFLDIVLQLFDMLHYRIFLYCFSIYLELNPLFLVLYLVNGNYPNLV